MDYKELIEQLRGLLPPKVDYAKMVNAESVHYGKSFVYEDPEFYIIEAAANAIENLIKKREALMDQIRGQCGLCKNRRECMNSEQLRRDCVMDKARAKWEWRGPDN